ncbi:chemotaxis protein [Actimicrobium sp. CCC2.4]|uniref:chemotaxis protein n=1 Tax=Actimicrobium sp. CCC2.4 TaxID=3048606 RepID=UPI002AC8F463|nr:chemotaxis protein [Actimicrobium sp. CCC2.4]MEB0134025.1 chemotaxis protein [Actimicrobium sp. CCC2.4]WPX31560.1 chemotaxis protein [Actimicrobium sp. CCC2.4]
MNPLESGTDPLMSPDNPLACHIRQLFGAVAGQGTSHLAEVETDLTQTALLLTEAIDKLGASFMSIHAVISAQQEAIARLLEGEAADKDQRAHWQVMKHDIDRHVNAAMTGLQFQDMTSQLLQRSLGHVDSLRGMIQVLGTTAAAIGPDAPVDQVVAQLALASGGIASSRVLLDGAQSSKAVSQTHMESGDIELF